MLVDFKCICLSSQFFQCHKLYQYFCLALLLIEFFLLKCRKMFYRVSLFLPLSLISAFMMLWQTFLYKICCCLCTNVCNASFQSVYLIKCFFLAFFMMIKSVTQQERPHVMTSFGPETLRK